MSTPSVSSSISQQTFVPQVPGYILAERLGSGSYSTVYKAFANTGLRAVVAIKCIKISSLNKTSSDNLISEIGILKSAKHEHIVELKDFIYDKQHVFLIMEYCAGGDLSSLVRAKSCLPEGVVKKFLQQLASALQYLRTRDISHMDLKPQNILLSSSHDPRLKLADFGFAQHLSSECVSVHMRGSPLYMAPEIICEKRYDARVDLWSVGVIMFECLFGRAPFASKTFTELADKIMDDKAVEVPTDIQISNSCRDMLVMLLQRNPDDRMSFDTFFNHQFLDLEHMPCSDSLDKAVKLVTSAILADKEGDYPSALDLYCSSLEYFVPALHYESSGRKKEALRTRIKEYMDRAEELKHLIRGEYSEFEGVSSNTTNAANEISVDRGNSELRHELMSLYKGNGKLMSALSLAENGEQLEDKDRYEDAVGKYKDALAILLEEGKLEAKGGRRRELLYNYIKGLMSHAEQVKAYVRLSRLEQQQLRSSQETRTQETFIRDQCRMQ